MGTQRSKVRQALLAVVVVVALGAASSPFWLFSSAKQGSFAPELTEKIADILSLSEDEETADAGLTKSTAATATAFLDAAAQKATAAAGSAIKAPASAQGTRTAPPIVATTTTLLPIRPRLLSHSLTQRSSLLQRASRCAYSQWHLFLRMML